MQDDLNIRDFLQRMGSSLTSGDVDTLAELWEPPVFVLADQGDRVLSALSDMKQFFAEAKQEYHSRGIVATRPDILHIEWLTHRIAIVDVRWPHLDAQAREHSSECATYTLRCDDSGSLRLRCAVMRGLMRPAH